MVSPIGIVFDPIRRVGHHQVRPDIAEQFGIEPAKGIMLFGPPGCGKTLLMKALATELHVEMINVKCSDIMSKWYGESESRMSELFKTAKELGA